MMGVTFTPGQIVVEILCCEVKEKKITTLWSNRFHERRKHIEDITWLLVDTKFLLEC